MWEHSEERGSNSPGVLQDNLVLLRLCVVAMFPHECVREQYILTHIM